MNTSMLDDSEHWPVWHLIPWQVNGRLSESDRLRLEAHVLDCGACRAELALQRRIHSVMAAEVSIDQIPTASLNKLRERLDSVATRAEQPAVSKPSAARAQRAPMAIAASLVGALGLGMAVMLGIPALQHWHATPGRGGPADYRTVTSATPPLGDVVIRAVFQSTLTLAQLQTVLDDARLRIVGGPTEAGVYSLAMNGSGSIGWSLQRLRGHDGVRFAEPLVQLRTEPDP